MHRLTKCRLLVAGLWLLVTLGLEPRQLWAQDHSPAELIEGGRPPAAIGTRPREVGVETAAPLPQPSIVKAKDGRLLMIGAGKICASPDGGKNWSSPEKLSASVLWAIHLQSGLLGGPGADRFFYTSADEGKTWKKGGSTVAGNVPAVAYDAGASSLLIQTRSGRLVMPVRFSSGAGHAGMYTLLRSQRSYGTLGGKLVAVESHAHYPEPDITHVVYSDNDGQTWNRSDGGIMIWDKQGYGGMWPADEPTVVEASNGDILLFLRTTLGRVYISRSGPVDSRDAGGQRVSFPPGVRFDQPQPTSLAASYSPCVIRRIPKTGDLLLVWNQVSGDEIRPGYRRGRLSSAISKDDGKNWQHFRTIDSIGMLPAGRVEPDAVPQMTRGLDYVGVLPEDFGVVHYPTVELADDSVFVFWSRSIVKPRAGDVVGRRMWTLPLSWFYQDEPAASQPATVVLQIPADDGKNWDSFQIPARFYEDRFFCRLQDLAVYLKSPVGRLDANFVAPVHQVVTCLGWTPHYNRRQASDERNPRLTVACTHPHAEVPPLPSSK